MSVRRGSAVVNSALDLRMRWRYDDSGQSFDPILVDRVQIIDSATSAVLETITDITNPETGVYKVETSAGWNTTARTVIDKWRFKKVTGSTYEYLEGACVIITSSPAPAETSIVTLDEVKNYLKIDDGSKDTLLNIMLGKCTSYIETLCNRKFTSAEYQELYITHESRRLILAHHPVSAVSVLSLDIDVENKTYDDVKTANEILIENEAGIVILYNDVFPESIDPEVYIKYTAGYSAANMPPDLKQVVIELIMKKFYDIEQGRFGMVSRNVMSENISFEYKDISDMNMKVLMKYSKRASITYITVSGWSAE